MSDLTITFFIRIWISKSEIKYFIKLKYIKKQALKPCLLVLTFPELGRTFQKERLQRHDYICSIDVTCVCHTLFPMPNQVSGWLKNNRRMVRAWYLNATIADRKLPNMADPQKLLTQDELVAKTPLTYYKVWQMYFISF